jgi:hypothetical protein
MERTKDTDKNRLKKTLARAKALSEIQKTLGKKKLAMPELRRVRQISLIAGILLFLGTVVWIVFINLQSKFAENSTRVLILLIISGTLIAIGRYGSARARAGHRWP